MTGEPRPELAPPKSGGRAGGLVWFAIYFLIALLGRYHMGALQEDFGAFEDEASHMVTSAMMRGYVTSFSPTHPLAYVEDYYLAYPKVASGQWPPVLHGYFGLWMILFGVSRWALLLGAAGIAALAASGVRALGASLLPRSLASLLGVAFLGIPLVQELSATPMTELMVGAMGAFGVLAFVRYLQTGLNRHALLYGLITLLAVWTKGNGTGLILVAVVAPWLAGRPSRWLTRGTMASGLLVGLGGGAWYFTTMRFSQTTWAGQDRTLEEYASAALRFYSTELWWVVGSIVGSLALLGILSGLMNRKHRDLTAASVTWLVGLSACHLFIRTGIEPRHVAAALPVILVLAGQGALWTWKWVGWASQPRTILAAGTIASGIACQSWAPAHSVHRGYQEAVQFLMTQPEARMAPWLVSSDALGEGLVVSEAVLHDPRHEDLQVLRASKLLAKDSWLGMDYEKQYASEAELLERLRRVPVGFVFFDRALWRRQWAPHDTQLLRLLQDPNGAFEKVAQFPVTRDGMVYPDALEIYRLIGFEDLPQHPLRIEDVLHRDPTRSE